MELPSVPMRECEEHQLRTPYDHNCPSHASSSPCTTRSTTPAAATSSCMALDPVQLRRRRSLYQAPSAAWRCSASATQQPHCTLGTRHWCCCTLPQLGFDSVLHHRQCKRQVVHCARHLGAAASVRRRSSASATKTTTGSVARSIARIGVTLSSAAHGMQGMPRLQARSFSPQQ